MRSYFFLVPVVLGGLAVIQGVLNRRLAGGVGLASAAVINNFVLLVAGLSLFAVARWAPQVLPPLFTASNPAWKVPWWIIIPGLCGFGLVTGLPFAISKIGASATFLLLIGAQIIASLLWDMVIEKRQVGMVQLVGALLVLAGAALTMKGK